MPRSARSHRLVDLLLHRLRALVGADGGLGDERAGSLLGCHLELGEARLLLGHRGAQLVEVRLERELAGVNLDLQHLLAELESLMPPLKCGRYDRALCLQSRPHVAQLLELGSQHVVAHDRTRVPHVVLLLRRNHRRSSACSLAQGWNRRPAAGSGAALRPAAAAAPPAASTCTLPADAGAGGSGRGGGRFGGGSDCVSHAQSHVHGAGAAALCVGEGHLLRGGRGAHQRRHLHLPRAEQLVLASEELVHSGGRAPHLDPPGAAFAR
mmetsp:Transcript_37825/g.113132  ORF Transcript_37825/g.113132 Transcript_37825/m.113132 type:complete len:267 (+) Transcript_37825:236-1036(+)